MQETGPPAGQTALFTIARLVGLASATLVTLLLIRLLDIDQFGTYATATGVFLLIGSLGYLGADQLMLSRRIDAVDLARFVPLLAMATIAIGCMLATVWPGLDRSARWVLVMLAGTRALELQRGPWALMPQLDGRHTSRAARELLGQLGTGVGAVCGALIDPSAVAAAAGGLVGATLVTGWAILAAEEARPSLLLPIAWGRQGALVRSGFGFASSAVIYSLINAVGLAVLPLFAGSDQVAVFRAAMLIYTAALVVPIAVNNDVLRPHLYRRDGGVPRWYPIVGRMLWVNLGLAVATGVGLLVVGRLGADGIFGSSYHEVGRLVVPLAVSMPLAFVGSYVANMLIARGMLRRVVWVQLALLFVAVVANAGLARTYQAWGSVLAVLVVDAVGASVYVILAGRSTTAAGKS